MHTRAYRLGLYVLVAATLIALHVRLFEFPFDDAYIHFRIAENLATHGVPYFNLDEPVMGSSSSAWTLVLAAVFTLLPFSAAGACIPWPPGP